MNYLTRAKGILMDFVHCYLFLDKTEKRHFRKTLKEELICLGILDADGKFIESD